MAARPHLAPYHSPTIHYSSPTKDPIVLDNQYHGQALTEFPLLSKNTPSTQLMLPQYPITNTGPQPLCFQTSAPSNIPKSYKSPPPHNVNNKSSPRTNCKRPPPLRIISHPGTHGRRPSEPIISPLGSAAFTPPRRDSLPVHNCIPSPHRPSPFNLPPPPSHSPTSARATEKRANDDAILLPPPFTPIAYLGPEYGVPKQIARQLAADVLLHLDGKPEDKKEEESRGLKRKAEDQLMPGSLMANDVKRSTSKSPFNTLEKSPNVSSGGGTHTGLNGSPNATSTNPPSSANSAPPGSTTAAAAAAANRYSIYGPTAREGNPASWAARYAAYGHRMPGAPPANPSQSPSNAPRPSGIASIPANTINALSTSPPRKPTDLMSNAPRVTQPPSNLTTALPRPPPPTTGGQAMNNGYGHYGMTHKDLVEHREQLREGKKWLEGMMTKTEKLLSMVENKMALSGESSMAAPNPSSSSASIIGANPAISLGARPLVGTGGTRSKEDLEYEERERNRNLQLKKIEDERIRDKMEREKKIKEREQELRLQKEREIALYGKSPNTQSSTTAPGASTHSTTGAPGHQSNTQQSQAAAERARLMRERERADILSRGGPFGGLFGMGIGWGGGLGEWDVRRERERIIREREAKEREAKSAAAQSTGGSASPLVNANNGTMSTAGSKVAAAGASNKEKEAEKNLSASRRTSTVSPALSKASTTSTSNKSGPLSTSTPSAPEHILNGTSQNKSKWDGEPIMAGNMSTTRNQHSVTPQPQQGVISSRSSPSITNKDASSPDIKPNVAGSASAKSAADGKASNVPPHQQLGMSFGRGLGRGLWGFEVPAKGGI